MNILKPIFVAMLLSAGAMSSDFMKLGEYDFFKNFALKNIGILSIYDNIYFDEEIDFL